MHTFKTLLLAVLFSPACLWAQQVLPVPVQHPSPQGEEKITLRGEEKIITGVTEPTISVYLPDEAKNTGAAVILCPGGAMRMLSWTNDVERMAKILNERGIAAIGLKYRLNNAPMNWDGSAMPALVDVTGFQQFPKANANPMPSMEGDQANLRAVEDARQAIKLVRQHATEWKINPSKVGFLGFSAGGGVAIGATILAQGEEMPNYLVTVYGPSLMDVDVPQNAPDLLILTRADHGNVAAGCLQLFLEWKKAGKNAEVHMYGDGNGPFALADRRSATTTDSWTDNLFVWLEAKQVIPQTSNFIRIEDGGSGPYKAVLDRNAETPDFTLYRPKNLEYAVSQEGPLPLVVFANGGCAYTSKNYENYLTEIASHGYLVAAVGTYDEMTLEQLQRLGMTDTEYQIHAIDVMQALNADPKSQFYQKVNMQQICAMGQSCGGGQALTTAIADKRVTNCVALNSGFARNKPPFPVEEPGSKRPADGPAAGWAKSVSEGGQYGKEFGGTMTQADLAQLHSPVLYLIGGPEDVAYPNANENYELVKVPVALCNLPVGHMATYNQHHGGAFADVTLKWLDWQMKHRTDGTFFLQADSRKGPYAEWQVQVKNWK